MAFFKYNQLNVFASAQWSLVLQFARDKLDDASENAPKTENKIQSEKNATAILGILHNLAQTFFHQLIVSSKINTAVQVARYKILIVMIITHDFLFVTS